MIELRVQIFELEDRVRSTYEALADEKTTPQELHHAQTLIDAMAEGCAKTGGSGCFLALVKPNETQTRNQM